MGDVKVLNLQDKRKESVEKKRRNFERMLFDDFLGCYGVIDEHGTTFPVELVDISHDGCMFQTPVSKSAQAKFKKGSDLTLRIYFTKNSYIPVVVNIRHMSEHTDESNRTFLRYGCEFDKTLSSFKALETFIHFIYQYAEVSSFDKEQHKVYFL